MRVIGLVLVVLVCALGILLFTRGRWGLSGEAGLAPLEAPTAGIEEEDWRAAGGTPRGGAGAAVGEGPLRVTASRLPGRCVWYLGDEGIPGVLLEFFEQEQRLASTRSDANGEFAVELGQQAANRVEVTPPPGFWIVEQGMQEDRYLVRLAPSDVGPLRARLADWLTGEPVPEYVVQVRDEEGWAETVKTDGKGVLLTRVLLKRGAVTLLSTAEETAELSAGSVLAVHPHEPNGASPPVAVIGIPVGPTYRLLLQKPKEVPLYRLRAFLIPADWLEEVLDDMEVSADVRAGNSPWIRFPRNASWIEDARLVVSDANGHWRGVAAVDSGPGVHLEPVPIRLERMARLAGTVIDVDGEGVARADVELRSLEASRAAVPRLAFSNGLGNFVLEGVPPGAYEVSVRHAIRGACRELINVRQGDEEWHRLRLEPYVVAGDVSGVVRSKSGSFRGLVSLSLEFEQEEGETYMPSRYVRVSWREEAGEYVGRFKFAAVVAGKCLLRAKLRGVPHTVMPASVEVEAPMSDLEIGVEDDREVWSLGMLVLDNADGRWIAEARLRVTDGRGEALYDGRAHGWTPERKWAEDEALLWEVRAPGYFTERGDRGAFASGGGAERKLAVVRLRRD